MIMYLWNDSDFLRGDFANGEDVDDTSRAAIVIAHEFGHTWFGFNGKPEGETANSELVENVIRAALGAPRRTIYRDLTTGQEHKVPQGDDPELTKLPKANKVRKFIDEWKDKKCE